MNAPINHHEVAALAQRQTLDLSPQNFEQALTFSKHLASSDMVPKDFKGRPENCLIAMQWGAELGLKPLQAIQNIAVINGRPALWGDAVIALVRGSALCEFVIEDDDGTKATCRVKRRGEPEQSRAFSMEDAKSAGLLSKQGPWTQYPKRMRQLRARAFALRDVFPDVLRGMPVVEELQDMPAERHMGPAEVVPQQGAQTVDQGLPSWTDEKLDMREAKCREWAAAGKAADDAIAFFASKGTLTEAQKERVRGWMKPKPAAEEPQPQAADTGADDLPWKD